MIVNYRHTNGHNGFSIGLFIALLLLIICSTNLYAQQPTARKAGKTVVDTIPRKGQWAFRTNALDWILTIPNIAIEYDLSNDSHNKYSIGAQVKWNWNTTHKFKPSSVLNLFDARIEGRKYFRTTQRSNAMPTLKDGLKEYFKGLTSTRRMKPRYWRAYYWGVYADYATYSIKLTKKGVQGVTYGVGVTGGYTVPLYSYKNGSAIDFEAGASIGFMVADSKQYGYDAESNCYPILKDKGLHLVPYPMVTDLRIAFVYRFTSSKDKYKNGLSPQQQERKDKRDAARRAKQAMNDSINAARKIEKAAKIRLEVIADALKEGIDTLTLNVDSIVKARTPLTPAERAAQREEAKRKEAEEKEAKKKAALERQEKLDAMTPEERKAFLDAEVAKMKEEKAAKEAAEKAEKEAKKKAKEAEKEAEEAAQKAKEEAIAKRKEMLEQMSDEERKAFLEAEEEKEKAAEKAEKEAKKKAKEAEKEAKKKKKEKDSD
ncbi:MAG: DUF3575 domain-containing protein [Mediterranea massiliensis]|nr:DUF3575 domain-containing protein [Mediterranea massiliensis]